MKDPGSKVGGSTEELIIEAKGALRIRKKNQIVRIGEHFRNEWQLYVMLLPTIIWLLVFLCKPMYSLQIAFKEYSIFRGVAGSPWDSLEYFETLFNNDQFIRALRNTVYISLLSLFHGRRRPKFQSRRPQNIRYWHLTSQVKP